MQCRIISNGKRFKVQVKKWFLFVPIWVTMGESCLLDDSWAPKYFGTEQKAQKFADALILKDNAKKKSKDAISGTWKPTKTFG